MEGVKYYLKEPFLTRSGAVVNAYKSDGGSLGSYTAYYHPERGTATLYPRKGGCNMPVLGKHEISVRLLTKDY